MQMKRNDFMLRRFFIKLFNWEYWPFHVVYFPIYFYWVWLMIKARSVFFFNTANPAIKNGGFLMESKKEIYDLIPQQFYPKTILVKKGTGITPVHELLQKHSLKFPLVAKPDIGMRGLQVKLVSDYNTLLEYLNASKVDFILQEYVDYNMEAGIFYCRMPGEEKGKITGIVAKELLALCGDGIKTMEELIISNDRFLLQLPALRREYGSSLQNILPAGETHLLVPYGNHSRGAKFIDASSRADEALCEAIDRVCRSIPGFYYGRLDIRFSNWESLKSGKEFSIIELNGAGSEPTHIYDPAHSVFFAWKEIIKHLDMLYRISMKNRKKYKLSFMSFREGMLMLRENRKQVELISAS